ncbi:hypothetical protein ACQ4PT_060733 [Festuca glaucescens]
MDDSGEVWLHRKRSNTKRPLTVAPPSAEREAWGAWGRGSCFASAQMKKINKMKEAGDGHAVCGDEERIDQLRGTRRRLGTRSDGRWRSLKEQRDDPSAYSGFDLGESKTTPDSQASKTVWNIPPDDPAADTSEKAF